MRVNNIKFTSMILDKMSSNSRDNLNSAQNSNFSQQTVSTQPQGKNVVTSPENKKLYAGSALVGTAALGAFLIYRGRKNSNVIKSQQSVVKQEIRQGLAQGLEFIKIKYQEMIKMFPEDESYYKEIASGLGLKPGEEFKLFSVMGKQQLSSVVQKSSPKDFQVGENFEGVKNFTYKINLHNHTKASDGQMSVREILEQARKWANKMAEKNPDSNHPFIFAITDHDTMEGVKEAFKIISENPEQYKNLRFVAGSEISVSYLNPRDVSKPLNYELVGYCLNPFNKNMNRLLASVEQSRKNSLEKYLNNIKEKFPEYDFSIEEAKMFHPNVKNIKTNGVLYIAMDYAKFKIELTESLKRIIQKNPELEDAGLHPNNVFKEISADFYPWVDARGKGSEAIPEFLKEVGLKKLVSKEKQLEKNFITDEFFEKSLYQNKLDEIRRMAEDDLPTITDTKNGYCIQAKDVFDATDSHGFWGFAHPAKISPSRDGYAQNLQNYCQNNGRDWREQVFENLINNVKNESNGSFRASEFNYQSYGNQNQSDRNYNEFIKYKIQELGLLKTGGIDCHKSSIFKKHQVLSPAEIEQNNLGFVLEAGL